jgi:hypothetical protein
MKRVVCPFHKERTPSCVLYSDHYCCYGCGKSGPLSELEGVDVSQVEDPEPEDLAAAFAYIDSLPLEKVRGLMLPSDVESYFIAWPDKSYYKRRFYNPTGVKYIGAAGHKKPPFWARQGKGSVCVLVEGEINALSIAEACPDFDVMSPGGTGDFSSKRAKYYLQSIRYYEILVIITDADKAGALACIELMGAVSGQVKKVVHHLMPVDANEVLCEQGPEALRGQVYSLLEGHMASSA